jgi:hypothetical protein
VPHEGNHDIILGLKDRELCYTCGTASIVRMGPMGDAGWRGLKKRFFLRHPSTVVSVRLPKKFRDLKILLDEAGRDGKEIRLIVDQERLKNLNLVSFFKHNPDEAEGSTK